MKPKVINKVISQKFNDFLSSIKDEHVKKLVEQHTIITGGCIASMLLKEKVNDYDIYFRNKETVKAVADYYVKKWNTMKNDDGYVLDGAEMPGGAGLNMTPDRIKIIFKSRGVVGDLPTEGEIDEAVEVAQDLTQKDEGEKYRPIFMSNNAVTLSHGVQIIIRFYGDPDDIHQHYDYMHCTNYWTPKTGLVLKQEALECLLSKELKYVGSKYPIASIVRLRKFIKRGWTINAGQVLKISYQISKLDLDDINVLEDQLTGVDVAYFYMLVEALQKQMEKDPNFKVDYLYLAEIIDRIF